MAVNDDPWKLQGQRTASLTSGGPSLAIGLASQTTLAPETTSETRAENGPARPKAPATRISPGGHARALPIIHHILPAKPPHPSLVTMLAGLANPRNAAGQLLNFALILSTAFMVRSFSALASPCGPLSVRPREEPAGKKKHKVS